MADMFCHKLIDASFFEYLISFWIINQIDVIFAIFAFEGAIRQESAYWPVPRLVYGSKFGPIWQKNEISIITFFLMVLSKIKLHIGT